MGISGIIKATRKAGSKVRSGVSRRTPGGMADEGATVRTGMVVPGIVPFVGGSTLTTGTWLLLAVVAYVGYRVVF